MSLFPSNPWSATLASKILFLNHTLGLGTHDFFALDALESLTTARFVSLFDFLAPVPDVQFRSAALLRFHLSRSLRVEWNTE